MNYKYIVTMLIIFMVLFSIGVHMTEKGLNKIMGLDIESRSFDLTILDERQYKFTILGEKIKIQRYYKVCDFCVDSGYLSLGVNEKKIKFNSLIPTGLLLKNRLNLDKKSSNMYN